MGKRKKTVINMGKRERKESERMSFSDRKMKRK